LSTRSDPGWLFQLTHSLIFTCTTWAYDLASRPFAIGDCMHAPIADVVVTGPVGTGNVGVNTSSRRTGAVYKSHHLSPVEARYLNHHKYTCGFTRLTFHFLLT